MTKASTTRRCPTIRNVFGSTTKAVKTLSLAVIVVCTSISCVSPLPAGESAVMSVMEVQQGKAEKGLPVRWGGTIVQVHNKSDMTVLEIVSRPLLRSGRPRHNDVTDGRFMAEISGFLDPEIVAPGRDISVIGTIERLDDGSVGETPYRYPVMTVFDYQFWKKLSEIDPRSSDSHYFFSDGYWRDWPHGRRSGFYGRLIF